MPEHCGFTDLPGAGDKHSIEEPAHMRELAFQMT
jgi:hypothetical protein